MANPVHNCGSPSTQHVANQTLTRVSLKLKTLHLTLYPLSLFHSPPTRVLSHFPTTRVLFHSLPNVPLSLPTPRPSSISRFVIVKCFSLFQILHYFPLSQTQYYFPHSQTLIFSAWCTLSCVLQSSFFISFNAKMMH